MPATNIPSGAAATSAWANEVADAIQELEADVYPTLYGQLALPWSSITGKPATFAPTLGTSVAAATTFGASPAVGSSTDAAKADHHHGTPAAPTSATTGSVAAYNSPATAAGGKKLFVGTSTPTGAAEGDVWVKG